MKYSKSRFCLTFCAAIFVAMPDVSAQTSPGQNIGALVTDCDVLAAHQDDKLRRSDGVEDAGVIPGLAVPACEENAASESSPLVKFQLARAYFSAGRLDEAAKLFIEAADASHAVAAGYAGDAYLFGRGVEKDLDKARKYYQIAVAGGFEQAQPMIDAITFDASVYMIPMVNGIYQGIGQISDPVNLAKNPLLNAYAFSFATSLNGSCDGAIKPDILLALMGLRYKGPITAEVESSGDFQVYTAAGDYDAQVFVKRHRCDGPVAEQLIRNLSAFIALNKPKSGDSPQ